MQIRGVCEYPQEKGEYVKTLTADINGIFKNIFKLFRNLEAKVVFAKLETASALETKVSDCSALSLVKRSWVIFD